MTKKTESTNTISQQEFEQLPYHTRRQAVFFFSAENTERFEAVSRIVSLIGADMLNGDYEGPLEIEGEADYAILYEILRSHGLETEPEPLAVAAVEAARQVLRVATGAEITLTRSRKDKDAPVDTIVVTGPCNAIGDVKTIATAAGLRVREVQRAKLP